MNQSQFIQAIADQTTESGQSISKADVTRVLLALTGVVHTQLKAGEELTLPGIGKLKSQHKEAKTGRNPKTGEPVAIAAKTAPKFTAAKALKDALNDEKPAASAE